MTDQKPGFLASLRTSAAIAKKHAAAKKLQLFDLKEAHFKLGCHALENQIALNECASHYTAISQVDEEIAMKRTSTPQDSNATLTERAKLTAHAAKDRAVLEALLFRRKGLITAFGETLSAFEFDDSATEALAQSVKAVSARIASIEAEALVLEQSAPQFARNRLILAFVGIVALFLCYQGVQWFWGTTQARRSGSAALSTSLKGIGVQSKGKSPEV